MEKWTRIHPLSLSYRTGYFHMNDCHQAKCNSPGILLGWPISIFKRVCISASNNCDMNTQQFTFACKNERFPCKSQCDSAWTWCVCEFTMMNTEEHTGDWRICNRVRTHHNSSGEHRVLKNTTHNQQNKFIWLVEVLQIHDYHL